MTGIDPWITYAHRVVTLWPGQLRWDGKTATAEDHTYCDIMEVIVRWPTFYQEAFDAKQENALAVLRSIESALLQNAIFIKKILQLNVSAMYPEDWPHRHTLFGEIVNI